MTALHVIVIAIGAALAALGVLSNHSGDTTPVATMIVGGALGNATMSRGHGRSTDPKEPEGNK